MDFNIYKLAAVLGLLCIIAGITRIKTSQKKEQFILFITGGILLEVYSLYIKDTIFIILQLAFIISAIFEFSMLYSRARKLDKSIKQYLVNLEGHIIKFHKK